MSGKVLVTGGAGFLGSHFADELQQAGCGVRVLDDLPAQVHGPTEPPPACLLPEAEFIKGDVRHCFAEITRAKELPGYEPQTYREDGLTGLADRPSGRIAVDRVDQAALEFEKRGLTL